jgi:ABC-type lipoprotein release transport system permease subunit
MRLVRLVQERLYRLSGASYEVGESRRNDARLEGRSLIDVKERHTACGVNGSSHDLPDASGPWTLPAVLVLLVVAGIVATAAPLRRAVRVQPGEAMRVD